MEMDLKEKLLFGGLIALFVAVMILAIIGSAAKQDERELTDRLLSGISQESLRIKDGSRGFAELMKRFFVNT